MEHRQWISRYRDELKGIAILWVVLFHIRVPLGGILYHVQKIGYGGVDILLFLMGFGLYHSFAKNAEGSLDIQGYWKRRMQRVLPAYLPFIVVWMAVMLPSGGLSTVQAIRSISGNLFLWGYWFGTPKFFNWYISALLLFLVMAPFLYGILTKSRKPLFTSGWMLLLFFLAGFCCIGLDQYMAISRLPVFWIGMVFAMKRESIAKPAVRRALYALAFAGGLFLVLICFARYSELLLTYGMYWHPFLLITPPLCIGLGFLLHKAEKAGERVFKPLTAPLRLVGRASFEIYLFNIWLAELGKTHLAAGDLMGWLLWSVVNILLGIGYHFLVGRMSRRLAR